MSLIACSECQHKISITASNCPNCGSKKPFNNRQMTAKEASSLTVKERRAFQKKGGKILLSTFQKIFGIGIALIFIFGVVQCSSSSSSKQQAELNDVQTQQQKDLKKAIEQMDTALKDPRKVRYLECIGVNPWKVKPQYWTPPTKDECARLEQILLSEAKSK